MAESGTASLPAATESPQLRDCRVFSQGASALAMLAGTVVLVGWAFADSAVTGTVPGLLTMKPNTALGFVLAGLSVWLLRLRPGELRSPRLRQVKAGQLIGGAVSVLGLLVLAEYFAGPNLGIDELFFPQNLASTGLVHPGRIPPATSLGFALLGASLVVLEIGRARYLSQLFAFLTTLNGLTALVGHAYGPSALHQLVPYSDTALPTSILFVCLGLGLLASRPQFGWMAAITSDRMGGLMARRVLPVVSTLPIFLGWLRWRGELAGDYKTAFGLVIYTLGNVLMLNVLLWMSAFWLNRVDAEREQMAGVALESQGRMAGIIHSAMDSIITLDEQQRVVQFNSAAESMFRCKAADVMGQSIERFIPPQFRAAHAGHIRKFGETGVTTRGMGGMSALWAVRVGGEPFPIEASISQIIAGEKKLFTVILRDITARRRAEQALQESEERLQLFIEHAPAALAMFDREMRYLQASWRWRADYGLGERELLGVSHYDIFPEIPERWKQIHRRGLAGEILRADSDRFERADGSVQWIRWEIRPWHERSGEIGGIVIFAEDISESKLAQEQLATQAEELARQAAELLGSREALATQARMLQSVLDNINDGLVAADAQGRFLIWNPAAERILGRPRLDLPPPEWSRHFNLYLPDKTTLFPAEELPLARAIGGHHASAEMFIRHGDAGYGAWIEAAASPLRDEHGRLCGGVVAFRDITQRMLADQEIRRLNADLERRVVERTAQLAAVNQELESFTYSVSHDLRAPLRQIGGFAKILSEDYGPSLPPEAQRHLGTISQGAHNLSQLINEMLNLSRLERQGLQRRPVALNALVEEIIAMLREETQGRRVEWKMARLPILDCDPVLTKQVFQNLISNALKYSRKRERAVIEIGQSERDGCAVVFVRDNGAGFDMKYADKLFGVFQRLHKNEEFEGIGIGLATVARIVRKHGGKVWAEAEPDKGATFYFTLSSAATANKAMAQTG